jgi:tetratricopeptide (TPR) repeat protein
MWPFGKKETPAPAEEGQTPGTSVRAEMLWKAGSRYLGRKQYEKALASLQEAYELQPSRLEGRLNLGAVLYLLGRPEEAVPHLKYVLAFDPQNTVALLNLAAAYDAVGELDLSVESLEKLVGDRPNWADANYNLAVAYLKQDRLEDATLALRRELTLNPKHDAARTLLNEVHLKPRRKKAEPTPEGTPSETDSEGAVEAPKPELSADNS